jgi:outer membrane protein assembly factor BamB
MIAKELASLLVLGLLQWPMYQLHPDHNAVVWAPFPAVRWTHTFGGKINGGLAIAGKMLFVESFDWRVTALDPKTGATRWSTRVPGIVMTTPIVADGIAVVGTGTSAELDERMPLWGRPEGDVVLGLDAQTGRVRWRYPTIGEDMPSPALVRIGRTEAIVFANGDDHIRALALRTGRLIWERPAPGIASMSSAVAHGERVFVVVGTGPHSGVRDRLLAIDSSTGNIVWGAKYGNADCSPTIAGGLVFVEGSAADSSHPRSGLILNDVAAIDERTGGTRWQWYSHRGPNSQIGSDEQAIAGLARDGRFYESVPATREFVAFEATTGRIAWRIKTDGPVKMSAVETDGLLYFGDTAGTLYVARAIDGAIINRRRFPSYFTTSSPVIFGDTLFVANNRSVEAIPLVTLSGRREASRALWLASARRASAKH